MTTCSVTGCIGKTIARSLCNKHYSKWKKYGDPTAGYEESVRKGEGHTRLDGYRMNHVGGKCRLEHILLAEKATGKSLPYGAVVHHVDCNPTNNNPSNLVVCPNHEYHMLIHARQRAFDACGNASWRKCVRCHKYDAPENLYISQTQHTVYHRKCEAEYARTRRKP